MLTKRTAVWTLIVVLVLALGATGVHAWQDDFVQQARHAFYRGDYATAEELWRAVLEDMEDYAWEANFFLGMTCLRKENLKEAQDFMAMAYDLRPDHYYTLTNYARILYRMGRFEDAYRILDQVPEEEREYNEQYHNLRGLWAMAQRNLPRAIERFSMAVAIAPDNYYVQNNLGLALIRSGEFQRANDHLKQAAAQEPPEAYVYNNLGVSYENLNRLEEARESYETALERDPEHSKAAMNLQRVVSQLAE